ncbi:hypothetical protein LCGC14_2241120 [marine sediment metagenome]|uniref:Uncharacterized protein n=1 Tax=marine sediment metagenome TaxID=412755 RepID=A0A0F9FI04_9ZZZZ
MAYLKDLPKPTCYTCHRPAKVALHNSRNAELGLYCPPCGQRELRKLKEKEGQE